jgi:hypothetical protein
LHFWRYTENERNYLGWHFMVDAAAGQSVAALAGYLETEGSDRSRVLVITPPSKTVLSIPNNKGGLAAWESPGKLRVGLVEADPSAWSIEVKGTVVEWRFGSRWATVVADAFADPEKHFDSTIGGDPRVWSWGLLPNTALERTRAG